MACVSLGGTNVTCTIHDERLPDLECALNSHKRIDCDVCGQSIKFTDCSGCKNELVRCCAKCQRDFCMDCGASFGIGWHISSALCRACHPYLRERDE